ncbi:MutS domain V [Diaporthe amygdali]|uniref:MutS domain V n=1 Tax=Phomopsis amygdali TaxID=1214568 RepID=UPI0022FE732A|nr:MutS domain V [Diaporthe amygdali]KAJ0121339.1 MutS domain V [Diaporthe amygdali]
MLPSRLGSAARSSRATFHKRRFHSHLLGSRPAPTATLRCRSSSQHHGIPYRAQVIPRDFPHIQIRGKKTTTVVSLDDLPQGLIRADSLPALPPDEDEAPAAPSYPTVVLQARRNMQRFDNCVLLTRVGGFYELYFEHADEYGPLLNLKVAQKKTAAGPVPMAGFPFFQLDRFLKILVQDLNRYVAVAEEFPNTAADKAKSGGLMHDRKVARIITPGTLIDEQFMDPYANNYVMAIHLPGDDVPGASVSAALETASRDAGPSPVSPDAPGNASIPIGLAWLDLSTGHFFTQTTTLPFIGSMLSRVCPKEVVLDEGFQSRTSHVIFSILAEERHLITYAHQGELVAISDWAPMLESEVPPHTLESFTDEETKAGSLLLHYVKDRLQGISMKLQPPLRHETMQVMDIDKNSMRSLEIKQTIRDSAFRGSLLHAIRRTVTKSGARLLNEWLSAPSTSLDVIRFRQDLVACFIADEVLREGITLLLRRSHDSQRLVQKFALGRGDADDLLDLASTIKATEDIIAMLLGAISTTDAESTAAKESLKHLTERIDLDSPRKLASRIREAMDEEGIVQQHQIEDSEAGNMIALAQEIVDNEGSAEDSSLLPKSAKKRKPVSLRDCYGEDNEVWIMKPDASRHLKKLHSQLETLLCEKENLAASLRDRLGAPSLTLKWTPGLGHICHIKGKKDLKSVSSAVTDIPGLLGRQTQTSRSFHLPEWTELGRRLDQARFHIRAEEQRVFQELRQQTVLNIVKLRRNAGVLDELDIATSFARLATEQNLVRPVLNSGTGHVIVGGRHPTVEGGLREAGRTFASNDCFVGAGGSGGSGHHGRVWLITGPNMAGKSTFLRQNALITILAQIGCYVPASYAEIGVVDAMFSRVGSADNLYGDQSTFMVEMLETATILRQATARSFVIMDEIGRGTTPEDGCAVAFACLHHLVHVNKCRTLFATHFHDVADIVTEHGLRVEDGGDKGAVEMYCTDVAEDEQGGFVYVHKLRRGVNRQSHALKVARLAGLPEAALQTAREILIPQRGREVGGKDP